jgi:hypothetical protein
MKGWIYRRAADIKDFGERIRPRFIGRVIRDVGLALRGWDLGCSTAGDFQNAHKTIAHRRQPKEEPDKDAMAEMNDETLAQVDAVRKVKDDFFCEANKEEANKELLKEQIAS